MILNILMRRALLVAALVASSGLTGCVALLLGGTVVGGSLVATDRRSSGAQVDDEGIELKSIARVRDVMHSRGNVSVTSYNRLALITGEVPNAADKVAVGDAVAHIDNVRSVVNELEVTASTGFMNHSSDTLVTSKVKASFIEASDLQTNAIKVVTERGIVYLMGRVTEREADRAASVARGVSGVRKVVKVFEIVTPAELADTVPAPGATPASAPIT